jgi:hypothetical protein
MSKLSNRKAKRRLGWRKGRYVVRDVQPLGWDRDMQRSTRQLLKEDTRRQVDDALS